MNLKDGRWRESILLLLAFIGTGIQLSVTGPVLPDLAHRTGNTLSEYGILFLTRAIGYIFGAFVAIPVVDKIEIMFLMMFVGLCNTVAAVSLVFCSTLAQVSGVLSFDGFTMGFLDTAGNVAVMRLWRRDEDEKIKTTMLHLMHAAFAFGGLLAPVIARPFLAEFHFNSTVNGVIDLNEESKTGCSLNQDMIRDSEDNLNSLFYLLAMILLFITMLMALEWIFDVQSITLRDAITTTSDSKKKLDIEIKFEKELAALLFGFFCFYVGTEMVFTNFIYSFGICKLQLERDEATLINTIFWLTFTIFRALSAIQARYQSAKSMLWQALIGSFIFSVSFAFIQKKVIAYVLSGLFGAAMSNSFATGFLYAESFMPVNAKLASTFIIGGSIGWAGVPGIAGKILETDPKYLPIIIGFCIIINAGIMIIIDRRGSQFKENIRKIKLQQLNSPEAMQALLNQIT